MKVFVALPQGEIFNSFIMPETIKLIERNFEVSYNDKEINLTPQELYEIGKDKDILITGWGTPSLKSAGFYEKQNNLKMLAHTGGSVADYVDDTAYQMGIKIVSGNKMYARSTAEGALAYILTGLRHIPDDVYSMHQPDYWTSNYRTKGLIGKTVGIIGVGAVAKNLISYLKPFGVKIKVYDAYKVNIDSVEQVPLDELLSTCDIVSLHCALSEKTKGMIDAKQLSLLKDGALLINTARGPIIDEQALVEELKKGRIYAVLDVYTTEPLSADSCLRNLKNAYLIPHKAGPAYDYRGTIGYEIAKDIVNFKEGKELLYEISLAEASRMTKHV